MIGTKGIRTMSLTTFCSSISAAAALLFATTAFAADIPPQKPGDWTVTDFRFHTGEVLPELKLHYVTIGEPTGHPVLVLHGSNGSGQTMLGPNFAGELFGPGQPLDAAKYYIIVPDAVGAGRSSKPSNGLRMAFPQFNYEDQVRAQYRLLTEQLGIVAHEIKRVKNGTYYEIPASAETVGHGTPGNAKWWKHLLPELLSDAKPGQ
jgi:homoserine O-acetyltransferase/O-succinyltransferase